MTMHLLKYCFALQAAAVTLLKPAAANIYCSKILVGVQILMGRALEHVKLQIYVFLKQEVNLPACVFSQLVRMVLSGWLEEHWLMRDEWKCARVDSGGLCVMIYGALQMLVWCAGSLAIQDTVSNSPCGSERTPLDLQ